MIGTHAGAGLVGSRCVSAQVFWCVEYHERQATLTVCLKVMTDESKRKNGGPNQSMNMKGMPIIKFSRVAAKLKRRSVGPKSN